MWWTQALLAIAVGLLTGWFLVNRASRPSRG
jgi:hypothetical protein